MRVQEGDVIGTKDGRYGRIELLVSQKHFVVKEMLPDANHYGENFWTGIENVASIV